MTPTPSAGSPKVTRQPMPPPYPQPATRSAPPRLPGQPIPIKQASKRRRAERRGEEARRRDAADALRRESAAELRHASAGAAFDLRICPLGARYYTQKHWWCTESQIPPLQSQHRCVTCGKCCPAHSAVQSGGGGGGEGHENVHPGSVQVHEPANATRLLNPEPCRPVKYRF